MVKEIKTPYDNPSAELSMAARGGFAQQAVAYRRGYADAEAKFAELVKLAKDLKTCGFPANRWSRSEQNFQHFQRLKGLLDKLGEVLAMLTGGADGVA